MFYENKCVAVLGASYLQRPLYEKLRELKIRSVGISFDEKETCNVEGLIDTFYEVSIIEKEAVLEVCKKENIDGIVSIASDVAVPTIAYVCEKLNLIGNSPQSAVFSTDKYEMRKRFKDFNLPSPDFSSVSQIGDVLQFLNKVRKKVILKPVDRSGSLGVQIICPGDRESDINEWVNTSLKNSFSGKAIVEEYIQNREISVEYISDKGNHFFLNTTDKVTSGPPHFVEIEQHQPAKISEALVSEIKDLVPKALDSLGITNGASHSELMIDPDGKLWITEVGARMGGDFIGSTLTQLSTGYDFVKGVIDCSLGQFSTPVLPRRSHSGIYFLSKPTKHILSIIENPNAEEIVESKVLNGDLKELTKSSDRSGYFVYQGL